MGKEHKNRMILELEEKFKADIQEQLDKFERVKSEIGGLYRLLPDGWVMSYDRGDINISKYNEEKTDALEFRIVCSHVERLFGTRLKRQSTSNGNISAYNGAKNGIWLFISLGNPNCEVEYITKTRSSEYVETVVSPNCLGLER